MTQPSGKSRLVRFSELVLWALAKIDPRPAAKHAPGENTSAAVAVHIFGQGPVPEPRQQSLTDYWLAYYVHPTKLLCSLCGNTGIIDTRFTAVSPAGVCGGRRNFCICPNGQIMRERAMQSGAPGEPSTEDNGQ